MVIEWGVSDKSQLYKSQHIRVTPPNFTFRKKKTVEDMHWIYLIAVTWKRTIDVYNSVYIQAAEDMNFVYLKVLTWN